MEYTETLIDPYRRIKALVWTALLCIVTWFFIPDKRLFWVVSIFWVLLGLAESFNYTKYEIYKDTFRYKELIAHYPSLLFSNTWRCIYFHGITSCKVSTQKGFRGGFRLLWGAIITTNTLREVRGFEIHHEYGMKFFFQSEHPEKIVKIIKAHCPQLKD